MKKLILPLFFTFLSFGIVSSQIVINEINYNTHGTDDADYVELYNNSGQEIMLLNYTFTQGFEYTFPLIFFPADSYLVLTVSKESLMETYGVEGIQWTAGSLGNGEDIQLLDADGNEVDYVDYDTGDNGWPGFANGLGYAFQLCNVNLDNATSENWQITNQKVRNMGNRALYGTPGQANTCVNEPIITTSRMLSNRIEKSVPDTAIFNFYLENSNGLPSNVNLSIDPSSTASPEDYSIVNMDVNFDGFENEFVQVRVAIMDDNIPEDRESLIFNITPGDNAISINERIEIAIYDNDRTLDQGLVIAGVFDADDTDNFDNYGAELYAIKDIPDLSKYSVGMANNGGGSDGIEIPLPAISLNKGDNFFISDSELRFFNFFGVESQVAHPDAFITGDDAVELFEDGVVIDIFGDINVDGTGLDWEFSNGWAQRLPDTGPDGSTFVFENWLFSSVDVLIGPINDACAIPYIFDFYMYTSTEDVLLSNSLELAPNPVTTDLFINLEYELDSDSKLFITNNQGSIVSQMNLTNNRKQYSVDVFDLPQGMYYLTIESKNGIATKRFIKM